MRVVVVGAGIGGLTAAVELARRGVDVTVLERAAAVGGKMRVVEAGGRPFDAGPTVLTMRWVFDELFDRAGASFGDRVPLATAEILGRHGFADGSRLDLFADRARSIAAVADFAGAREADGYARFCDHAARIFRTVEGPFLRSPRPTFASMLKTASAIGLGSLVAIDGHRTLWRALGDFFRDERLLMLFGRYATYAGSSPFEAPGTLAVIAHVERVGVHYVRGGMARIASALRSLAEERGATFRTGTDVAEILAEGGRARGVRLADGETIGADAVVWNGDAEALARGLAGPAASAGVDRPAPRSLSAITFATVGEADGFPLVRHNVFFPRDYRAEHADLFAKHRLPADPTVYVCAQDREDGAPPDRSERLFFLVNAPATGDSASLSPEEIEACRKRGEATLRRAGLTVTGRGDAVTATPATFARLFPGTGGALYGAASHGMRSPFARTASRAGLPGLYLAGGSAHPGAGVPMASLSGTLAASAIVEDRGSTSRS